MITHVPSEQQWSEVYKVGSDKKQHGKVSFGLKTRVKQVITDGLSHKNIKYALL